jgi:preprotein translocase subunit SecA
MDQLRKGIHLRGYAQKNPKQEYKRESFLMFTQLLEGIKHGVISNLSLLEIQMPEDSERLEEQRRKESDAYNLQFMHLETTGALTADSPEPEALDEKYTNVGRNDACPCNSGRKFKQCHGALS